MTNEVSNPLEHFISREALLERPHRKSVAIDPANPLEIDDAVNIESINKQRSEFRISVHIADAGLLLGRTAVIDSARQQGWSQYDENDIRNSISMVPKEVYKDTLGLDAPIPEGVPAIEVGFDFSMKSRAIGNISVSKARVEIEKLSYKQHDRRLKTTKGTQKNIEARERLGVARRLFAENTGVNPIGSDRKSEDIVAFFMIAANRIMADQMQSNEIPWLFRNHSGLAYVGWRDERERRALEKIKPGSYGSAPIGHDGLNVDRYCHFTSPLRRFPDLANHLNLHAHMTGVEPPFSNEAIDEVALEMTALYIERNKRNVIQNMAA